MNQREYEWAKEQGRQKRRNLGKRKDNPYRLGTSTHEHDAWNAGWDEADDEIKRENRR